MKTMDNQTKILVLTISVVALIVSIFAILLIMFFEKSDNRNYVQNHSHQTISVKTINTVIEKFFTLRNCEYSIIPVKLRSNDIVYIEWSSDIEKIYVGIGSKDMLADFQQSITCLSATLSFHLIFAKSGSGYRGKISFVAPVDAEYYIVVFHGWHLGETTGTVRVTIEVRRGS